MAGLARLVRAPLADGMANSYSHVRERAGWSRCFWIASCVCPHVHAWWFVRDAVQMPGSPVHGSPSRSPPDPGGSDERSDEGSSSGKQCVKRHRQATDQPIIRHEDGSVHGIDLMVTVWYVFSTSVCRPEHFPMTDKLFHHVDPGITPERIYGICAGSRRNGEPLSLPESVPHKQLGL